MIPTPDRLFARFERGEIERDELHALMAAHARELIVEMGGRLSESGGRLDRRASRPRGGLAPCAPPRRATAARGVDGAGRAAGFPAVALFLERGPSGRAAALFPADAARAGVPHPATRATRRCRLSHRGARRMRVRVTPELRDETRRPMAFAGDRKRSINDFLRTARKRNPAWQGPRFQNSNGPVFSRCLASASLA